MSDQNQDKRSRGLYGKFHVTRTDGTSAPGCKHEGCEYFVLDLTHDPFAAPALLAYAVACAKEYPALAADLRAKVTKEAETVEEAAAWFGFDAEASALVDKLAEAYRLTREGVVLHALRSLDLPGEAEPSPAVPPPVRPTSPFYEAMAEVNEKRRPDRVVSSEYAGAIADWPSMPQPSQQLQELPDGVSRHVDGTYWASCRRCDRSYELFGPPEEFTEEGNVCGGSDRCVL